jgi:hypothetical protein
MKRILILISITFLITSCNENLGPRTKAPDAKRMELDSTFQYYDQNYKVYTLEGCEYVVVGVSDCKCGSHKGN